MMMGLGGIIVGIGVVTLILAVRHDSGSTKLILLAIAGAISVSLAAAIWMFICYNRFALPPRQVALN